MIKRVKLILIGTEINMENKEFISCTEQPFTIKYGSPGKCDHLMDFKIYFPVAKGENGDVYYGDQWEKIEDALPDLWGTIKWDGCIDMFFADDGYLHVCNLQQVEAIFASLKCLKALAVASGFLEEEYVDTDNEIITDTLGSLSIG